MTRSPKLPMWLKMCTLVFMLPIGLIVFLREHEIVLPVDFNSVRWKSNVPERMNMFHDLIKKKIVMGKTSKELQELLGKPDGSPRNDDASDTYYYRLEEGDLLRHGKYIQLVGFKLKNDRVVEVLDDVVEKYF